MTSPSDTPLDLTCSWGVTRGGIFEPCDKPAVAWQLDEEAVEFGAYPVCPAHTRVGRALPLKRDAEAVTLAAEVRRLRSELKSATDAYETSHESRIWAERAVRRQEDENAALLEKVESMRRSRPRTVGNLTARDLGRRVRINEREFTLKSLEAYGREYQVILGWALNGYVYAGLDTPVEFLDDEPANAHQQPRTAPRTDDQAAQVESDDGHVQDATVTIEPDVSGYEPKHGIEP